jgi:hypothetical protein
VLLLAKRADISYFRSAIRQQGQGGQGGGGSPPSMSYGGEVVGYCDGLGGSMAAAGLEGDVPDLLSTAGLLVVASELAKVLTYNTQPRE